MKRLEYILNAIHYGLYLFLKKTSIPPGRTDRHFISKGLGFFWGVSIVFYLFSIAIIINNLLNISEFVPTWVMVCLGVSTFGIEYYFIDRNKKRLIYVKKFMREHKPWKYILIGLLFWIGSMVLFYFSLAIKF